MWDQAEEPTIAATADLHSVMMQRRVVAMTCVTRGKQPELWSKGSNSAALQTRLATWCAGGAMVGSKCGASGFADAGTGSRGWGPCLARKASSSVTNACSP
eukprot:2415627-Rhodomonas_salina.1